MDIERWSPFKNEKLIEAVRLFPCLWQVNTKSYKDAVAKANENSHVAGVGQKFALSRTSFALSAFCSVETKQKEAVFPRIFHRWSHSSSLFFFFTVTTKIIITQAGLHKCTEVRWQVK